jgi:TonB dependent receptor/Carboxypeptidase regulatory-like domain/TonB-dependent Receptor Plug Domain
MARVSTRLSRAFGLAALAAFVASAFPVRAEMPAAGSLGGSVNDEAGSPLPGVTVEAAGPVPASPRIGVTDAAGVYRFSTLPAGRYDVTFRLLNFVGVVRKGIVVEAQAAASADATLRLSVSADVVVTGKRTFRNLADATEPGESLIGIADASTQGVVTAEQIALLPVGRPGDVLETIPGLVISQHSGEGKANQYYLRGFNLDHGTDFATTVAGMQINMPTHAHGQGYTDLNFVIPELVSGVQYKKGPYFVEDGDFTTAGSANIDYANTVEKPEALVQGGSDQYVRGLILGSPQVGEGHLLYALEGVYNNGPWVNPDNSRKYNGVLRYSVGDVQNGLAITAMGYQASWNSTDQIPQRAVQDGEIGRFGTVDPTDGGETHRYSLSAEYQRSDADSTTHAVAYFLDYKLNLFSNFTYDLDDPVHGDQFEQADDRDVYGMKVTHKWMASWLGLATDNEIGLQGRFDDIHTIGLFHTEDRERLSTTRLDRVRQGSVAAFFQNDTQWAPRFRMILGLRGDVYHYDVTGISDPENSGTRTQGIFSPKLSMIFGPFGQTEIYANAGYGFHSNDGRGATTRFDPSTGDPVSPVTPLARAKAAEVGVRSLPLPGWQTTVALWGLDIASELVFVGDAGTTEPSRPSRRYGLEWSNSYRVLPWMTLDLDLSLSKARYRDDDPVGDLIPGAVQDVVVAGVSVDSLANFSGSIRVRYFGPRSLVEDGSVTSKASTTLSALLGYELMRGLKAQVEVFNILNAQVSDIDYYYASRLPGEPAGGVDDIHFHPAQPRSARFSLVYGF